MVTVDVLKQLSLFRGLHRAPLEAIADAAAIVDLDNNTLVARQHDRAIALFILLSGSVQFVIRVDGGGSLLVGVGSEPGVVVGWSVFRAPFRYMTDVRCAGPCRFLRIPHHVLDAILSDDPATGVVLLRRVAESLARRLDAERTELLNTADDVSMAPHVLPPPELDSNPVWTPDQLNSRARMADFLAESTVFEGVEARYLDWISDQADVRSFAKGDVLFRQESLADELFILVDGQIGFSYCDEGGERCVFLRALEGSGDVFGWSALVDPRRYHTSAMALQPTRVVAVSGIALEKLCEQQPAFGVVLLKKVLQVIGSRSRATRVRLVARRYDKEVLAVRSLLDQSAETLSVSSSLHKIPYLLENRLTLADAFHALELTRSHGDATERNLAELSLEILQDVHRELEFYQDLQKTYEAVANAPEAMPPEAVRRRSMEAFRELFGKLSYRIRGDELLPPEPGSIIIMNHLENHMDTRLPNDFRLTLDSHFVSSMMLYPKYGEAPIRVVRKPELGWFGYQRYFDRLDYIYVYPGEVDQEDQDQQLTREQRNRRFIDRAAAHLEAGKNLVIAPEGCCSYTEDSPGPFKPGAFRLAAAIDPEPLIVPVAVANFDKRLTRTTTAAIVFPPFRLSEQLAGSVHEDLIDFVNEMHARFRDYVRQAVELARS